MINSTVQTIKSAIFLMLVLSLLSFSCSPKSSVDEKADDLIHLTEKLMEVESYTAQFTIETIDKETRNKMEGIIEFKWPNKERRELYIGHARKEKQIIVNNGETEWVYSPNGNFALKCDVAPFEKDLSKYQMIKKYIGDEHLQFKKVDKISGVKVSIFENTPKADSSKSDERKQEKVLISIGIDDGIIRKVAFYDQNGNPTFIQSVFNVKTHIDLSDDEFDFMPPEGVSVTTSGRCLGE